jgi:aminomethyltransferase
MTASQNPSVPIAEPLRHLPLEALHLAEGARLEAFAGWSMPIHYPLGIMGEHRHTRTAAGLFDVSHMGQILLRARSGDHLAVARALERLVPVDVEGLRPGRQRYALFTNSAGGIRGDLMIANLGDAWLLVVNAAATWADLAHLESALSDTCTVELLGDRALLAVQGPEAGAVVAGLAPALAAMRFLDARCCAIDGALCYVSRSGYTGEDGFELSVPLAAAEAIAARLMHHPAVRLVGLGARDSLRLEAGLCLCGHDLDAATTPVEAALEWAIQPVRRTGGLRPGGFPGAELILSQLAHGAARRRVGLRPALRPVREGAALFTDAAAPTPIGWVTSGTYGPWVQYPVAMGYVPVSQAHAGTHLFAEVRGQRTPLTVSPLPFAAHRYHR